MVCVGVLAAVCLIFAFINGFHDGCNVVATTIASRSISPRKALLVAGTAEFAGSVLLGTSVALTMSNSIIKLEVLKAANIDNSILLLTCGVTGGIAWNLFTWWRRLPTSSSHALIGGLLGAGFAALGPGSINFGMLIYKVLIVLFTSPILGFVTGFLCLKLLVACTKNTHPRTNNVMKRLQWISTSILGLSHGSNDAQKSMGIIALALYLAGITGNVSVPLWVQLSCALMISAGLTAGGWKMIKTVGAGIFSVKPIHSLSSQLASASTIITASLTGGPVSTSHIVNSSIMGVGAAERMNAVQWETARNIVWSWILTLPAAAAVSGGLYLVMSRIS